MHPGAIAAPDGTDEDQLWLGFGRVARESDPHGNHRALLDGAILDDGRGLRARVEHRDAPGRGACAAGLIRRDAHATGDRRAHGLIEHGAEASELVGGVGDLLGGGIARLSEIERVALGRLRARELAGALELEVEADEPAPRAAGGQQRARDEHRAGGDFFEVARVDVLRRVEGPPLEVRARALTRDERGELGVHAREREADELVALVLGDGGALARGDAHEGEAADAGGGDGEPGAGDVDQRPPAVVHAESSGAASLGLAPAEVSSTSVGSAAST